MTEPPDELALLHITRFYVFHSDCFVSYFHSHSAQNAAWIERTGANYQNRHYLYLLLLLTAAARCLQATFDAMLQIKQLLGADVKSN